MKRKANGTDTALEFQCLKVLNTKKPTKIKVSCKKVQKNNFGLIKKFKIPSEFSEPLKERFGSSARFFTHIKI